MHQPRLDANIPVMMSKFELPGNRLYQHCDLTGLPFDNTEKLENLDHTIGQARALEAINFGIEIAHQGYNLYVMGSSGVGKHHTLCHVLNKRSKALAPPLDWCYVNNFSDPHKPHVMSLPAGVGARLRQDMHELVRDLLVVIPAAFDTDDYRAQVQEINDEFKGREDELFSAVAEEAQRKGLILIRTLGGYTIAPGKEGEVMEPSEFQKLSDSKKSEIHTASESVQQSLRLAMQQGAALQREHAQRMRKLDEEVGQRQVDLHLADIGGHYTQSPAIEKFLGEVRRDILERTDDFRQFAAENKGGPPHNHQRLSPFNRYFVNVVIDNSAAHGAPVVYEDNPTYQNLLGRVEHAAQFGTLLTDFTLIKSGALHRANGGFLVLDAHKVLANPFSWDALKRALRAGELRIQSLEQMLSLVSTISLEPEPIPLDVKVVLCGERWLYYLLSQYDPEFSELFKVQADFSESMPRSSENTFSYARLLATLQRREGLLPLERDAVARLIEQASRQADDSEKLTLKVGEMIDLLREADHCARGAQVDFIGAIHVEQAMEAARRRSGQLRELTQESILRGIHLVDTQGVAIGQINGLSIISPGQQSFGRPVRISATARLGDGDVIDIEREVKLGQAIHSKGVLILSAFLAYRFGQSQPLSLSASLVFEQSYGPVEGDSASAAELCALLSCLSEVPFRQDLAITGSINQHGKMQPIGGVNEKIEGFFELCIARGLTATQGVIIPQSNAVHLMLRSEVLKAVEEGHFHIYAVDHVDSAAEILSGLEVGQADASGSYPQESLNARIQARLENWSQVRRRFANSAQSEKSNDSHE